MRFDKFTIKSREAVQDALQAAGSLSHQEIGPEHVLLALLRQEEGLVVPILRKVGANPDAVRGDVQAWLDSPAQNFGWIVIGNEAQIETAFERWSARSGWALTLQGSDVRPAGAASETPLTALPLGIQLRDRISAHLGIEVPLVEDHHVSRLPKRHKQRKVAAAGDFDAAVLTKVDADAKGGSSLSVSYLTGKPVSPGKSTRVLVIRQRGLQAGLVVTSVLGMRHFDEKQRVSNARVEGAIGAYVYDAFNINGEIWPVFSMLALSVDPGFRSAAA